MYNIFFLKSNGQNGNCFICENVLYSKTESLDVSEKCRSVDFMHNCHAEFWVVIYVAVLCKGVEYWTS